jgi:hypothetical protein
MHVFSFFLLLPHKNCRTKLLFPIISSEKAFCKTITDKAWLPHLQKLPPATSSGYDGNLQNLLPQLLPDTIAIYRTCYRNFFRIRWQPTEPTTATSSGYDSNLQNLPPQLLPDTMATYRTYYRNFFRIRWQSTEPATTASSGCMVTKKFLFISNYIKRNLVKMSVFNLRILRI